ncbi:MAG: HEAT repeat domain-containing protein [Planctomycetota bacterium]|jgi:hypothetical protein
MPHRRALVPAFLCLIAFAPAGDLDVELDPGTPFDVFKHPDGTPTGGRPNSIATRGGVPEEKEEEPPPPPKPAPGGKHETVTEKTKHDKEAPPALPMGLEGVKLPLTEDWLGHLNWSPRDKIVKWEPPPGYGRMPVPTGDDKGKKAKKDQKPSPWNIAFPPKVPQDLYMYVLMKYLQILCHRPQVCPEQVEQFVIEMGYPGYYATTAVQNLRDLRKMPKNILGAIGPMVDTPPAPPSGEEARKIYEDLLSHYPYEPEFGKYILSQNSGKTYPILLEILRTEKHPFLVRNTVFILRCFNNPQIIPPLRELLMKTKDKVVRNRAVVALARLADKPTADWCVKHIGRKDAFRSLAVWAIGRIGAVHLAERVIVECRRHEVSGEFLLSGAPALGWLGYLAAGERKEKILRALKSILENQVPRIRNPKSWGGSTKREMNPDPPGIRGRIVGERVKVALALTGRQDMIDWMKAQGHQPGTTTQPIHITNTAFFNEALEVISQ